VEPVLKIPDKDGIPRCLGCPYYKCGNPIDDKKISWMGKVSDMPVWDSGYGPHFVVWCSAIDASDEEY
jgi:hypothetical protein